MDIAFENIPDSIRKPGAYFEYNTKNAVSTLPQNRQKLLLIGQRLSSGTVDALTPVDIYSSAEAKTYFGAGSMLHLMALAAITTNPYVALAAIALEDAAAGHQAAGAITFSASASASGTLTVKFGTQKVSISITSGDTVAAMATALAAAMANKDSLPVTGAAAEGVVTPTAKHKGTTGNDILISYVATNSCVAPTITAMSGGSGDPDIQDALDVIFPSAYDIIACPYNDTTSLAALKTHLDSVSGPLEKRPCIAVCGQTGLLATAITTATTVNSGRISGPLFRGSPSLPYELAASYASELAYEEDPAMPLNGLKLKGIGIPALADRLSRTEQESCLYNGVTPIEVDADGVAAIVRAVSMYTETSSGVPDESLLDITTIRTMDYSMMAINQRIELRFGRSKLTEGQIASARSEIIDVLIKEEDEEYIENVKENLDALVIQASETVVGRFEAKIPLDVVNGMHVKACRLDLIL